MNRLAYTQTQRLRENGSNGTAKTVSFASCLPQENQNRSSVLVVENESFVSYDPISESNEALSGPITAFAVASLQKASSATGLGSEFLGALYLLLNL